MAVYVLPFSHIDAFAMGAYISRFPFPNPRKQLAILMYAIPSLGFLTQYLSTGTIQLDTAGYEFTMFTAYKFVWGYSVLNYLFALIVHNVDQTKLFTTILDHFTLRYLGKISYGLYVYHSPVVWFLLALQLRYSDQLHLSLYLGQVRTFFVVLILTLIVSSLSFHLFEKPINNLKDKFFAFKPT
jgi:peptidoglycan/LPS O-acetylase OafA/YrhL